MLQFLQMFCQAVDEQPPLWGRAGGLWSTVARCCGLWFLSLRGAGLLLHKEVFDRERQSQSESRPWAGSQGAHPPPSDGKGCPPPVCRPTRLS